MVLDHARDFFVGFNARATDLAVTTPELFLTRWVTHFCAPVFVFLAGVSAYLYGARHGKKLLSRFLLTRGLWLVVLELTIVRFAWIPDPFYRMTLIQVIWVIGWAMVVLAAICRLPIGAAIALGGVIVVGHDALNGIHAQDLGSLGWMWTLLHERGVLEPWVGHRFFIALSAAALDRRHYARLRVRSRLRQTTRGAAPHDASPRARGHSGVRRAPGWRTSMAIRCRGRPTGAPSAPCSRSSTAKSTRRHCCSCS